MAQATINGCYKIGEVQNLGKSPDSDSDLLYFSSIDRATKTWLNTLQYIWGLWKKSEGVTKTLTDYYDTAPNPYLSALRILVNTSDFNYVKSKATLAYTVIEDFSKWLSTRRDAYRECLVPDLKLAAFRLITKQKNLQLTKMVSDVYEFVEHRDLFLPLIQNMVQEKKYKEAAQLAAMLRLQRHFINPEVLMLPLILQNKLTVVDDFLADCPEAQRALVTHLDSFLAPGRSLQSILEPFITRNQIPEVKMSTLQIRPMNKLVGRLTKVYNLPPEVCPNLNQRRGEGALQFLVYKRYVDCSLSGESWSEMVREAVGADSRLQLELVRSLVQANDFKEAYHWAIAYNIPKQQWPWAVTEYEDAQETDTKSAGNSEENWDTEEGSILYHELMLPRESIKLVDSAKLFEEFLDEGLKGVTAVGIDSEWKPSFGTKQSELALIQIATATNVFILDVTNIGNKLTDLWSELGLVLFENKNILKLGFGLAHDIAMIRDSLPALSNIRATGQGYMDMLHLWRKLAKEHNFQFPYKGDEKFVNESLSKLVELCLGHRLNKADQFSNWERRPLRESQMTYAALDAYCLLEVFEALRVQSERTEIPFHEVCAEVQHIAHKSPKKHPKKPSSKAACASSSANSSHNNSWNEAQQDQPNSGIVPAHEWRVVCDSMLGGLARQLRMCGCDCLHVEFDRGGDQSAKIAMQENRVLLTRGGSFHRLNQYVPPGHCYRVIADRPDIQLKEVLSRFNVLVTEKDIFSRCQICNHDEFVQVSKNTMVELGKSLARIVRNNGYHIPPSTSTDTQFSTDTDFDPASNEDFQFGNRKDPVRNNSDRTWHLSTETTLKVANCATRYRVRIQIDRVPGNVLKNVHQFYICEYCGKVYWDGSHMERVLNGVLMDVIARE